MFGNLYDRALTGERCWIRHADGSVHGLPVHSWLGRRRSDHTFDQAMVGLCDGPTIDLGCGPGRLVANLMQRGVPALGVDQSATAVDLARRSGAPALRRDVFEPLPGMGRWSTVLLADGNVGIGGDPWRVLLRAGELLRAGGRCIAEFDCATEGVQERWVRLESAQTIGPWFRWASVGATAPAPGRRRGRPYHHRDAYDRRIGRWPPWPWRDAADRLPDRAPSYQFVRMKWLSARAPMTLRASHQRCDRGGSSAGAAVSQIMNGSQMRSVSALLSMLMSAHTIASSAASTTR